MILKNMKKKNNYNNPTPTKLKAFIVFDVSKEM